MRRVCSLILCVILLCLSVQAWATDRDFWIQRYLSVSYPLKHVKVNSPFGTRRDPFTGAKASHNGLDLKAYYEEVYAMFNGTVKKVGADPRSGNYVVLQHGEYTISYCHLSKVRVSEGDELIAGDVVAISGNTGRSTGSHLHITCRYKGALTDPYTLLLYMHYAPAAMEQQRQYGIPASVTLAQMAFESDWGRSDLARKGNNYFGIKCSSQWLAEGRPYSLHNDDKPDEKFCNYATVEESIDHHSRLLMSDRYKRCHSYPSNDYHHWLLALKAAGYATARDYVSANRLSVNTSSFVMIDSYNREAMS